MNILCTNCFPHMQIHFVCELEMAEEHLERGDTVTFLECNESIPICEINPTHSVLACAHCIATRQHGLSMLSKPVSTKPLLLDEREWKMPAFASMEEVRAYRVEDFFLGEKLGSWLMSTEESVHVDLKKYWTQLEKFFQVGMQTYFSALEHLSREHFDKVYIFNGRMVAQAAWVAACKKMNVPFATHERLASMKHFHVFDGARVHEPAAFLKAMNDFWRESSGNPEVLAEAKEFFEERRRGQLTGWVPFVTSQTKNKVPGSWSERAERYVIFTSTEWELFLSQDFGIELFFKTQLEVLQWLLPELAKARPEAGICLRVHPNSKADTSKWWDTLDTRSMPNVSILGPETAFDTYALMEQATKVITFGSTIGAEATYWGKVSIMFGYTGYAWTDATWEPRSKEELLQMIVDQNLPPKPRENTFRYAGFCRAGGRRYRFSKEVNYATLTFKDKLPRARPEVEEVLQRHWKMRAGKRVPEPLRLLWERWNFHRLKKRFGWNFGFNYRKKKPGQKARKPAPTA